MALVWVYDGTWHTATATSGNDVVTLSSEGNVITNRNRLFLEAGNDFADLGFGSDDVYGGFGDDTIYGSFGGDVLRGDEGNDILYGGTEGDDLYGGTGMDALFGGAGHDRLSGAVADGQSDNLSGGDGNDAYKIYDALDVISNVQGFTSATSFDQIELYMGYYNMGATADRAAIEDLTVAVANTSTTVVGNALANVLKGNTGFDSLSGSIGNDTLLGLAGGDRLFGGSGRDSIDGGLDNDSIDGGLDNDFANGAAGSDTIRGGSGRDVLYGNKLASGLPDIDFDMLYGGDGSDSLFGGLGDDYLSGDEGDDTMDGGSGSDNLEGGLGNDVYYLETAADTAYEAANGGIDTVYTKLANVVVNFSIERLIYNAGGAVVTLTGAGGHETLDASRAGRATLNGLDGHDNLIGSTGNDSLSGGTGNDTLSGDIGDDVLDGGTNIDRMIGGLGNDRYRVDNSMDVIEEAAGGGTDHVLVSTNIYALSAQVENVTVADGFGARITANDLANRIDGAGFSDILFARGGKDTLRGGDGNDYLNGGSANDTLIGGTGNDSLVGDTGADMMQGGAGNDIYYVDNTGDQVVESIFGNGVDLVYCSLSSFTLASDIENLTNFGTAGFNATGSTAANRITGNGLADTIRGGDGADTILGGGGADQLYGGLNADRFVFSDARVNDAQIFDFQAGVDKLQLDLDGGWTASAVDGNTTLITSATGGEIVVDGLSAIAFSANTLFV